MSEAHVVALATTSVGWDGGRVRLSEGDLWAADDPFVKAHPDLFTDDAPARMIHRTVAPIEQATRRPGERRDTRRTPQG